jgi:hypothetical protein
LIGTWYAEFEPPPLIAMWRRPQRKAAADGGKQPADLKETFTDLFIPIEPGDFSKEFSGSNLLAPLRRRNQNQSALIVHPTANNDNASPVTIF